MSEDKTLLLGDDGPFARSLSEALDATLESIAYQAGDGELERWRTRVAGGSRWSRVVIAFGQAAPPTREKLCEFSDADWLRRCEAPFLTWSAALGAASGCCVDGGAIVAVVEAPPALDAAGFAPETGLADAVSALVRSIALSEGGRGVRANTVTTPARLELGKLPLPLPPLAGFPGRIEDEVAGAVRMLLSRDASGITGRTLAADGGRAW